MLNFKTLYSMKFKKLWPLLLVLTLFSCQKQDAVGDLHNTVDIYQKIEQEKQRLHEKVESGDESKIYPALKRLQEIGDWEYVLSAARSLDKLSQTEKSILTAKNYWLHNDFLDAEEELRALSEEQQADPRVQRLLATLEIEAWQLKDAENRLKTILEKDSGDMESKIVLGRSLVLQKKYDQALALAQKMVKEQPDNAAGYFLESDVYFWDQNPEKAEKFVKRGLELDPLNADARFSYGYAIWRRIDATQLDDMVAQWEIALKLNPLHFKSHWHLGNGHTNLTFSDYADPQEDEIRKKLDKADSLFTGGEVEKAIEATREVGKTYPESVLPQMHEASLLYNDFEAKNRPENLRKAEKLFVEILNHKKHYGPAHNGLAAVIKSERIPYLYDYDSLHQKMEHPKITNMEDLLEVFPDVAYYPGNSVKGMVWNQMYAAVVYFPFLVKQHRSFTIPPLHKDLAIVMKAPYFRFNTTFDNRQWMDIRGVGSGAAGIGYVERGAYGERNVILHEYTHLYHQQVMTDQEKRAIRAHYYNAMEKGLTLDYYSQNNEHEYFAQTYPAYFEPEKVHPLDFKSMNATPEFRKKDPEMYAFIDSLVKKQKAYLAGDKSAMAANWAQVYVNLAQREYKSNTEKAHRYIEKALEFDQDYLPAYMSSIRFLTEEKQFKEAADKLSAAKAIDDQYAPIYIREAELSRAEHPDATEEQAALYEKAYTLETDLMERAANASRLRDFYFEKGMLAQALEAADEYVQTGSTISTYLRDSREEARAFAAWQRAILGKSGQLEILDSLVSKRPFNYTLRKRYAEALLAHKKDSAIIEVLEPAYKDLTASKVYRPDYEVLMAMAYERINEEQKSQDFIRQAKEHSINSDEWSPDSRYKLISLLIRLGELDQAEDLLHKETETGNQVYDSEFLSTQAELWLKKRNEGEALPLIEEALKLYPYQTQALQLLKDFKEEESKANRLYGEYEKSYDEL